MRRLGGWALALAYALYCGESAFSEALQHIYFLDDAERSLWCGYSDEGEFKQQIQSLGATTVGRADLENDHVSSVQLTQTDETGDWAVNDDYLFDDHGNARSLQRVINILPEDLRKSEKFAFERGRMVLRSHIKTSLRTGKPSQHSAGWFRPPKVVAKLEQLPFAGLVTKDSISRIARGKACGPGSR